MFRFSQAGFECRNLRPGLLPVAARLLDVLAADEPSLGTPVGELQRLRLAGEVVAGNAEQDLPGANVDVTQRHFGRQRHPGVVQARLGRCEVGLGGLDAAAHAAEHVEFPARVETSAEEIARVAAADLLARLAAAGAARCGHAGILPGGGYRAACAGLAQFRLRAAQVGAGLQGFIDQPGQQRIVQALPPLAKVSGRRGMHHRLGCRVKPGPACGRLGRRRHIIRADRCAPREAESGEHKQQLCVLGYFHLHALQNNGNRLFTLPARRPQPAHGR